MSDNRFRDWTFIVYPDSAPADWKDSLLNQHLCFGVSPLHSADNVSDEYKDHWHVYIKYSGKKSFSQVCEDTAYCNGTIPQNVKSPVGLIRYFTHIDLPNKPQYSIDDIFCAGGFDKFVDEAFKLGRNDVNDIMNAIQDYIIQNNISEYSDLWVVASAFYEWRYVLNMYNCHSINRLITSIRNAKKDGHS